MKPLKPLLLAIPLFCAASFVTSCDDDDEYMAEIPEFSDVTFHVIETDHENLRVGDKIVATAVQSKKGRLLHGADMSWTSTPEASHSYKAGVVYDAQNENPTSPPAYGKRTTALSTSPTGAVPYVMRRSHSFIIR